MDLPRPSARESWWWPVLALGVGTLALSVGVGVGLRWIAAAPFTWQAFLGALCLLAGIGLVAVGVTGVGRRGPLRLVARLLAVVGIAVVVWTIAPALMATAVPPSEHGPITPADLGLTAREVTFETEDGVTLWAWYVPSRNGAAVVLRHGSGSTASDALSHAAAIADNGYGVLVTDARGHGLSGGTAMDFGWFGDLDVSAAVSFLADQSDVDPLRIGVVGLSMGGEEAIGAAGRDPRIAAVVAEGASARTEADKAWLEDVYGWRGWLQVRLEWLQYSMADALSSASRPVSLAAAAAELAPRPVLLVTAEERPDEEHAARFIQRSASGNVDVWTVLGAGHVEGLEVSPDSWRERVVGFLDTQIGSASPTP